MSKRDVSELECPPPVTEATMEEGVPGMLKLVPLPFSPLPPGA